MAKQPDLAIIDVRTEAEVRTGRIPNAEWMDISDRKFLPKFLSFPKDKTYCLYCASGGRTMMIVPFLELNGFSRVYELDGGIMQWISEGNPIQK